MTLGKPFSIFLKGNLKENEGVLSISIPFTEMRYNLWQISLIDFSYDCQETINVLGNISSNYVSDYCIKEKIEVSYFPVISQFCIKGQKNEKKCIHLNQNFFYINNFNETLQLFFR